MYLRPSQEVKVRQLLGGGFDSFPIVNFLDSVSHRLDASVVDRCKDMAQVSGPAIVCKGKGQIVYVLRDGYLAYIVKGQLFLVNPKAVKAKK